VLGDYLASSEADALDVMSREADYKDYGTLNNDIPAKEAPSLSLKSTAKETPQ
jgi:hypothetical protein